MAGKLSGSAIQSGTITVTQLSGGLNDTTNAAYAQANSAYGQANAARSDANTTFATVNTTFGTINTNYQAAYAQANTARTTANDAYNAANTKVNATGGSITGDLSITGNLTVQGNATTINVSNLSVNDSIMLLATGGTGDSLDIGFIGHIQRGATDTHVGLIRKAVENQFYLFDNYEVEPTNNIINVSGNNFRLANLKLGIANANTFVTSAGLDVTGQANAAYTQANAAYGAANNRVLKAGDTMTGNLIFSGATLNTATANITTIITGNALTLSTGTGSNANIVLSANGTEYLRVTNTGNVGIGTANPSSLLHIHNGTGDSRSITSYLPAAATYNAGATNTEGRVASGIRFNWYSDYWQIGAARGGASEINGLVFSANGNTFAVMTTAGNVGIGTTSPTRPLHVHSESEGTVLQLKSNIGYVDIRMTNSTHDNGFFNYDGDTIKIYANSGSVPTLSIKGGSPGRVGIGTTNPLTRLQVGNRVADDNSYTYDTNSLMIIHQSATSTTTLNDPKEVLFLARQGTGGQAYGAAASFNLSRYENNSVNSRTRLDIILAHGFYMNGANTTVMTMRSDGIVTTPSQPSFSAYLNSGYTHPSGVVGAIGGTWVTHHNTGSHYSTSTRRFTAPVAGTYQFHCIIATEGGAGSFSYLSAELWVNGSRVRIGGWGCGGAGGSYGETASSYVVYMNANDYAEMGCESNKVFNAQNGPNTLFAGYLIG